MCMEVISSCCCTDCFSILEISTRMRLLERKRQNRRIKDSQNKATTMLIPMSKARMS